MADGLPGPAVGLEAQPDEAIWSVLKRSLSNLTKHSVGLLTALVKSQLRRM